MSNQLSALDDHLGYWLRCLSNFVSEAFTARLAQHDISVAQWVVLRTLYDHEHLSLNDAAGLIGVDKSSLSRMMERLVQRKLVMRRAHDKDGRSAYLSLSAQARRLVPILAREADENDEAFFSALTVSERIQLLAIVQKLLDANGWNPAAHGRNRIE